MLLSRLSHKELIQLAKKRCIPPLLPTFYKGQSGGRVCIIGGCEDYTGAPYFSANATALMGCDLTHVICEKSAATVIKSYTPNLMVHPYLRDNGERSEMDKIKGLLERIHAIVIGPGLGRDSSMLQSVKDIIEYILVDKKGEVPIVIDADGLFLISQDKEVRELLKKFPKGRIILTPNIIEFKRISDAIAKDLKFDSTTLTDNIQMGHFISNELNCILVQKGREDRIYSPQNDFILVNSQEGSNKRVGGQGDTLTGTIGCMLSFSRSMHDFHVIPLSSSNNDDNKEGTLAWVDCALLSCYVGSTITRECSRLAFQEKKRAMQTSDLNDRVGLVYSKTFD
ncbi:similar to Saccharomyces cerevisiae YKL151C Putative protein of unknown function [Maudiozyma barnettii]|uniref:ATP-dependent (S)-NAD(P)H-hydrate dehydratase n=1 Tax=Maudiozyma barnettii TaxID=61262 RepID=A0A8H2VG16_9SACH|nr:NADHX dehydratase [Kazachstania barnettii]CAB4254936.1 similar to Saccharomyces cerevisiae YKL151C Putative protein of unknown function [Kazachstania barnettii]CAD1783207.1 similar to Saccharomyces cerevisiae YKL151C Putative protein of unknown function [Kazachstania barnettii]